jgi:uncharacterized protein YlxP (DUF503 family)
VISWDLEIIGAHSLKEKRSVVKSLKARLHNEFNVSVAETAHQDVWQRCELTACAVGGTRVHAEEVMQSADALVAKEYRVRIIGTQRSFM